MTLACRVLLGEDEPLIAEFYAETLTDLGHNVVAIATSGEQLIEMATTVQPDLIVTDIRMLGMDGISAVERILATRPTPVVLVSAHHEQALIDRAHGAGVMAYLVKPVTRADLATTLPVALRRFQELNGYRERSSALEEAIETRKLVARAKARLFEAGGLAEPEAHRRMQRLASQNNLTMAQVARLILDAGPALDLMAG